MAKATIFGLYLNVPLADMDPDETKSGAENAFAVLSGKTFGSTASPLYANSTRITVDDVNNDGKVPFNENNSPETISYRLNDQLYTVKPDTMVTVQDVTVVQLLPGGGTRTLTGTLRVMQDSDGRAFVMPAPQTGGQQADMLAYPIISVTMSTKSGVYQGSATSGISTTEQIGLAFRDGYVDGTDGNDTIVAVTYTGDIDGDRVDNGDAILPGVTTSNDDFIRAGLGDDIVWAGAGADSVRGNEGNDTLYGYTSSTVDDGSNDSLDGGPGPTSCSAAVAPTS